MTSATTEVIRASANSLVYSDIRRLQETAVRAVTSFYPFLRVPARAHETGCSHVVYQGVAYAYNHGVTKRSQGHKHYIPNLPQNSLDLHHFSFRSRGHVHFICRSHSLAKWVGLGVAVKNMQAVTGHGRIFTQLLQRLWPLHFSPI